MQGVIDSAALAAGREYQVTGDANAAQSKAETHFQVLSATDNSASLIQNEVDQVSSTLLLAAVAKVETHFLGVIGVPEIDVRVEANASLTMGGLDKDVEIALMLDSTGSMDNFGRMDALKDAAKDLVNIVVQDDQSEFTSRVAIVPFAHAVNVGDMFEEMTGQAPGFSSCVVETWWIPRFHGRGSKRGALFWSV